MLLELKDYVELMHKNIYIKAIGKKPFVDEDSEDNEDDEHQENIIENNEDEDEEEDIFDIDKEESEENNEDEDNLEDKIKRQY